MIVVVAILVGFALAMQLALSGVGVYAIWRYVYKPWLSIRKDIIALNAGLKQAQQQIEHAMKLSRLRAASMRSDAEVAAIERELMRQSDQRSAVAES